MVLACLELAAAVALQAQPADSFTATANAAACLFLGLTALMLLRGTRRLPRWLLAAWLILGLVRAIPLIGGRTGWLMDQSIEALGSKVSSETLLRTVAFQAGSAPAHLVNDKAFNFYTPDQPPRAHLPLAMRLAAYVHGKGTLTVASSAPVTVRLGSRELFDSSPPPGAPPGTVLTPAGPKSLGDIRSELQRAGYSGPTDDATLAFVYVRTALSGGWRIDVDAPEADLLEVRVAGQDVSNASLQLGLTSLTPYAARPAFFAEPLGRMAGAIDGATLGFALLSLIILARREVAARDAPWRGRFGLGAAAAVLYGAPHLADWVANANRLVVLSGGDDWLTYESFARNIRSGSLLMLQGHPLGQAEAFYFQALYPYLLALTHLAFGESVQSVLLLQQLAIGIGIVLAALALPARISVAVAGLLVAATGIVAEWFGLSSYVLSENALFLIVAVLLLVVSRLAVKPTRGQLWLVGVLLGLAVLARSTAWLAAPFVLLIVTGVPGRRVSWRRLALGAAPILLLAALIPVRNWLATGFPTPIPSSGSINIYQGFVPSGRVITSQPWLQWSREYDPNMVASVEAIVDAPGEVALKLADKALYVAGFPRTLGGENVPAIFFPVFLMWLLALPALLSARHSRLAWVSLAFALSHAATLILIFPNNYYYRLLVPALLPLAVWNTLGIEQLLLGLPEPSRLGGAFKRLAFRAQAV